VNVAGILNAMCAETHFRRVQSMKRKVTKSYRNLRKFVAKRGVSGEWSEIGNQKQFRTPDGAVLNWWKSTGALTFQGHDSAALSLEAKLFPREKVAAEEALATNQHSDESSEDLLLKGVLAVERKLRSTRDKVASLRKLVMATRERH
jgi:hypothetical protein